MMVARERRPEAGVTAFVQLYGLVASIDVLRLYRRRLAVLVKAAKDLLEGS